MSDNPGLRLLGLRGGPLALASRSPRRRELLERLQIPLLVFSSNVEEGNRRPDETPEDYVLRLAASKADACLEAAREAGAYACLAADTIVEVDGDVLEQPRDREHAVALLQRIGGRWHEVWTGLALVRIAENGASGEGSSGEGSAGEVSAGEVSAGDASTGEVSAGRAAIGEALGIEGRRRVLTSEMSRVYFERLSPEDLEIYLNTGEPMDKAGAYGIQGWGGIFVPRIEGDFFNVMGLPLAALRRACLALEGDE